MSIKKFDIVSTCKCDKCGHTVSPCQCEDISHILYADDKERVVGFKCFMCDNWILTGNIKISDHSGYNKYYK